MITRTALAWHSRLRVGMALTLTVVSGVHSRWVFLIAYGGALHIDMGAPQHARYRGRANWCRGSAVGRSGGE